MKLKASYPVGGGRQRLKVFVSPKTLRIQRRPEFPSEIDGIDPSLKGIGDSGFLPVVFVGQEKEEGKLLAFG